MLVRVLSYREALRRCWGQLNFKSSVIMRLRNPGLVLVRVKSTRSVDETES